LQIRLKANSADVPQAIATAIELKDQTDCKLFVQKYAPVTLSDKVRHPASGLSRLDHRVVWIVILGKCHWLKTYGGCLAVCLEFCVFLVLLLGCLSRFLFVLCLVLPLDCLSRFLFVLCLVLPLDCLSRFLFVLCLVCLSTACRVSCLAACLVSCLASWLLILFLVCLVAAYLVSCFASWLLIAHHAHTHTQKDQRFSSKLESLRHKPLQARAFG
jgi:hypothetical protein